MKPKPTEEAYSFRHALANDLSEALALIQKQPDLIDQPVYGASESALHFYSTENQIGIFRWLLDRGANPNGIAEDDFPLHAAAQLGNSEICKVLIKAGANPNIIDDLEETALHKASSSGHLDIITILLEAGADPEIREVCDERPIDQALPRKQDQIRALFKKHTQTQTEKMA